MSAGSVRSPRTDELPALQAIERAAGALFHDVGMSAIADDEPFSVEELQAYVDLGRAWVVEAEDARPAGYALVDIVDGHAHLEQLSVDPAVGRRGFGAALLTHVFEWADTEVDGAVTLTTFAEVPWNAPYYARHGFRVMDEHEIGPELRQLREEEAAAGLDPTIRVCMIRRVEPAESAH